jgi:hypothetical protein
MSGGSFNYSYSHVLNFSEELREKLNEKPKEGEYVATRRNRIRDDASICIHLEGAGINANGRIDGVYVSRGNF